MVLLALLAAVHGQMPEASNPKKPIPTARPLPDFAPGSWSLVLLPDTQFYSRSYPGLLTMQTQWIVRNAKKYDIRYVLGLGDITDRNADVEWRHAREAYGELDGHVPYAIVPGNHDYSPHGDVISGRSKMSRYFPPAQFQKWPTFGGVMRPGDITNSYHLFEAGGTRWIILALEWALRNATVDWANEILDKHRDRKAILVTHAYLYDDSTRYDYAKKATSQKGNPHEHLPAGDVNDGEELWRKLVSRHNFVLTVNGHVGGSGLGFLASKNSHGGTTHQMLVNYQMRPLGGEGYLRILEFWPDGRTVRVRSYSPLYDKYLQDAGNQFSFRFDR